MSVSPRNGLLPVSSSCTITPNEKTSDRESSRRPSACSGDMYAGVPRMAPVRVWGTASSVGCDSRPSVELAPAATLARPKSSSFTRPVDEIITFEGLRSRWTIPAAWAAARPSAASVAMRRTSGSGSGPRARRADSGSPSTYSIAMNSAPGLSSTS